MRCLAAHVNSILVMWTDPEELCYGLYHICGSPWDLLLIGTQGPGGSQNAHCFYFTAESR